jgi:hypothetical protein
METTMTIRNSVAASMLACSFILLGSACGDFDAETGEDSPSEKTTSTEEALSAGTLVSGDYLFPGQRLLSPQCFFHLEMQLDGNLVLYRGPGGGSPSWNTDTGSSGDTSGTNYAVMQSDGNFVVYEPKQPPLGFWNTGTEGLPGSHLSLQDDGNLVV